MYSKFFAFIVRKYIYFRIYTLTTKKVKMSLSIKKFYGVFLYMKTNQPVIIDYKGLHFMI